MDDVQKSIITVHDVEIAVAGEYGASSSLLMNTVTNESIVRVLRLVMNSSNPFNNGLLSIEQSINFKPDEGPNYDFGGITRDLKESDLIVVESTFNVNVSINGQTTSSGLVLATASGKSNVNVTNCDVNYTILFNDSSYARSPGVLGRIIEPNMTLVWNVSTRIFINNTETPGTGFIGTGVLGNFSIINTTADIWLNGDSRGTGFIGYVEQNASQWDEWATKKCKGPK